MGDTPSWHVLCNLPWAFAEERHKEEKMNPSALTGKVMDHQKTGTGHAQLMTDIVHEIVRNQQAYGFNSREDVFETLSLFYPRMVSLVRRYSGEGRAFEAFLYSSLKFFRKGLESQRKENAQREKEIWQRSESCAEEERQQLWKRGGAEGQTRLTKEKLDSLIVDSRRSASRDSMRKRMLYLAMKCAFTISEDQLERLARLIGIGMDHLRCRIDFLRCKAEKRLARQEKCIAIRNKLFSTLCFKERLLHEELRDDRRSALVASIERLKARLEKCRLRLAAIQLSPTNVEIALVLGVPKGTVDSGLFCLRQQEALLRENSGGRYA
jgi:hypothetical protein